jgi:tRNA/rRNA methyltransferase
VHPTAAVSDGADAGWGDGPEAGAPERRGIGGGDAVTPGGSLRDGPQAAHTEAPRIVLVSPKHAGNVGASARAMKNFGLADLWLVAPRCRIDHQARALAAHAGDVLDAATEVGSLAEALADRTVAVGTTARVRASEVHRAELPERVLRALHGQRGALVFGPEDTGLDNAALDRCRWIVSLPTAPYASLNLAQAVVVLCYLWHRQTLAADGSAAVTDETPPGATPAAPPAALATPGATPAPPAATPAPPGATPAPSGATPAPAGATPASREQFEGMIGQLAAVALRSGYVDAARLPSALRHLRALIDRAAPSAEEVARLRGLWRHLAWALEQPPERLPAPEAAGGDVEAPSDDSASST